MKVQSLVKRLIFYFMVGGLITLQSLTIFAQPIITGLNQDQTTITIKGINFGPPPLVVLFDNFEHGEKFAKQLESVSNNWFSKVIPFKEQDGNTIHRAKNPMEVALGKKGQATITSLFNGYYRDAFIAFSVKVPKGTTFSGASTPETIPEMSSWKFSWLMSGENGFENPEAFDICLPQHSGMGSMTLIGNTGTMTWLEKANIWWSWSSFNNISTYIHIDDKNPKTIPMKYRFTSISDKMVYDTELKSTTRPDEFMKTDLRFDRVNIPGWWGNGDSSKFDGYYDNIYVAVGENAQARILITDAQEIIDSKFAINIMATKWTDDSIVIDKDTLPVNGSYYLHISDRNGLFNSYNPIATEPALNKFGIKLPCEKCPMAPTPIK